jgi:hypothetical protein
LASSIRSRYFNIISIVGGESSRALTTVVIDGGDKQEGLENGVWERLEC